MKSLYRTILFFTAVSLSVKVTPSFAQWAQVTGPEGCDVGGVLIDSSAMAAKITISTSNGNIYVSSDTGSSWKLEGNMDGVFPEILVETQGIIFAANTQSGLYSSTDRGADWTQLMSGEFLSLYAHDSTILTGTYTSIYISRDLGATWSQVDTLFASSRPTCFAIMDSTIIVGTANGIIVSTDSGASWSTSAANLPHVYVSMLADIGGTLYANTGMSNQELYCSTDGGTTWQMISDALGQDYIYSLCEANGLLYAASLNGCFVSADSGKTWSPGNTGMGAISLLEILPLGTKLIAATEHNGIYVSADGGTTWTEANNGLPVLPIISVTSDGSTIIGGTSTGGIFLSTDKGETWLGKGLTNGPFYALAATSSKLFASNYKGLHISTDRGATWTQANLNPAASEVDCISIEGKDIFVGSTFEFIYHSSDGGNTWQQTDIGLTNPWVQSVAIGERNVYATSGGILYISTNDGGNWVASGNGDIGAWRLTASGNNIVLGLEENGIDVSGDNGASWNQVLSIPLDGIVALATDGSRVFAGTGFGKIYASVDFGESWKELPGSFARTSINDLTVSDSSLFVASDSSGLWQCPLSNLIGIAPAVPTPDSPADSSTNLPDTVKFAWSRCAGSTFYTVQIAYDEGFTDLVRNVSSSNPSVSVPLPSDSTYYWRVAAFDSAGAAGWSDTFSFKTGTPTAVSPAGQVPVKYTLFQNYPNPFNPATTIMFDLKEISLVRLTIFDILGQVVEEINLGQLSAGTYERIVDMSRYSSGVYFYRIDAVGADGENFASWKKMALLK